MPETRLERAAFVLGLLATAALAVVIARSWHHTAAANHTTSAPAATTAPAEATTAARRQAIVLALTASRATWIEVRSGSANGLLLFAGTLPSGTTKIFRNTTIWVRFGAASNLDARLNGRPVPLPSGTYNAVFGTAGFQKARS